MRELSSEGMNIQLEIVGYYEVLDKRNKSLAAPTFVLEVDLSGNKDINHDEKYFNFNNYMQYNSELNEGLLEIIKNNTKEYRRFINTKEDNIVVYHRIKAIDALKVIIKSDNTIAGNERVPIMKSLNVEYV